ncbi:hypothetical protein IMG5_054720 [Ichthyophthirius multifiliis]|uniref:ER membrane protein complex subunit 7 beta-sandwich domain-containing protein n=1 Tax=Ichthyophthirius multifiliis TaxID=5932 RepID=G0QN19_ICHMU|nr:hypothetical protein IMG5_054720 [Ichthyophthirius multifiliis]EGR33382.1 hypothetical protein IMG5_054720 [Ichthyophthirius multifiliis]|eukprot:XP_004037368.1 hypothetical protein IMG5_054720 [Ichthyophthirius multifiliis]
MDVYFILNYGQYETYLNDEGQFKFYNIPKGKYILEVTSKIYSFEKAIISYLPKKKNNSDYDIFIQIVDPITLDIYSDVRDNNKIILKPINRIEYFEKVEPFNILMFFFSGQGLMITIMVLFYFCSKNMPNMDLLIQQQKKFYSPF